MPHPKRTRVWGVRVAVNFRWSLGFCIAHSQPPVREENRLKHFKNTTPGEEVKNLALRNLKRWLSDSTTSNFMVYLALGLSPVMLAQKPGNILLRKMR